MDPTYPLVPTTNLSIGLLLIVTLMVSRIRNVHNHGIYILSGWILALLLLIGTQSIIWAHTVDNIAPVFCDICMFLNPNLR